MRIFLMAAAVLVGIANATLYSLIGNNTFDNLFRWQRDTWSLYFLYAFCAIFVGLLISGTLLRFAEDVLRETFFARYGLMVLTICLGGAALAVFLTTITFMFDERAVAPSRISEASYTLALVTVPGAMLGAIEGVVLAFPLAWLLGLFKKPSA
ncbi:MAG TPA: hypothetical protein VIZ60_12090 [Rubrobacter sp.]|jgi:hypothetical protein